MVLILLDVLCVDHFRSSWRGRVEATIEIVKHSHKVKNTCVSEHENFKKTSDE